MNPTPLLEVCVDSVESALAAESGGASRVELCQALSEGGITPSAGLLEMVKATVAIPVAVMIRPRGGDFLYSDPEFQVMRRDIQIAKSLGADRVVTGLLTAEGRIDVDRTRALLGEIEPLPTTFHRAFDMTRDAAEALEDLAGLGVQSVLTSGQESSVLEGLDLIHRLFDQAGDRLTIMPGGGITERNLGRILGQCPCREFHVSASSHVESGMRFRNTRITMGRRFGPPEYATTQASEMRVREFRRLADQHTLDSESVSSQS